LTDRKRIVTFCTNLTGTMGASAPARLKFPAGSGRTGDDGRDDNR